MAKESGQDKHEKAHDLADKALDEMIDGDKKKGERMIEEARRTDEKAVEELAREVEEDRKEADRHQGGGRD